jgi:RNA polymerase sigma factor (sigma-70 family)
MAIALMKKYRLPIDEDALSESYLALCEASARFDPGRGCKFSSYLFLYVRHRLLSIYAGYSNAFPRRGLRLKRYLHGREIDVDCLKNDIGYSCNGNEKKTIDKDLIQKGLRRLTSDQRQTVCSHYFDGLSCIEMAKKYGFTRRTHSGRIAQSLAIMRQALSTDLNTGV